MNGSLNTMNYLKPHGFLNRIKAFFKKRHTASIETQYEIYSVRVFDFHIDFIKNNRCIFRYGGIPYDTFSIYTHLNYLSKKGNASVKITLEDNTRSIEKEKKFQEYCSIIEKIYKDITFFGGCRECDGKQLYKFKNTLFTNKIDWLKHLK